MDQDIWQNILDKLEENINEQSFKTWFYETRLVDMSDKELVIRVPTQFSANYLNQNYKKVLSEISFTLYARKYDIQFITHPYRAENSKDEILDYSEKKVSLNARLNERYSFEDFVVGHNNNFAYSAAKAVAENPGYTYNPLFVYGESGMGKTHLMQAVGNFVLKEGRNCSIYYTTSEAFTNEMIESIRSNKMPAFRAKFRKVDLLLVDDIHFLSRKEGTQEEFFHTFNALFDNKKQIVLTSDRPPKDIPDLEKRLVTRFESGLLADLKNPDFETRVAILRKKAEPENIILSDEVINFIADKITSSVRALEGSLIRILAYASYNKLNPEDIDGDIAQNILSDMISEVSREITLDAITKQVCQTYQISTDQIMDKSRKPHVAFPRQVSMYLANLLIPALSLKDIAQYFNRKDHTTVIHAKRMIENQFRDDDKFRSLMEFMINELKK
ncbi:MAG: chromosomal replication initiator protein DnaA [Candidatus Cloacimonadaceae bacterium]|jgi:chromosomal replication initiator protein|nr:chromosomal replication initiator protein DnaA [Candidatus Cloacimonadota bacterium]MDY0127849.1 chromosomal replication initiator protein DnaA [Candidatus Cloacimonadaceae bacterium]MCB5255305.1 chromosomal replication initiator protein DnaA [Candidatus Cloacimonadota bacterium]MCK9178354.1 chromosomal replication initiator protein DnaA [Candidatus Cloacimonadota bacterium]MCK9242129.1 chromosomal replication initiator protein DnaA [Candidatus Cloacimonadota bacterium]